MANILQKLRESRDAKSQTRPSITYDRYFRPNISSMFAVVKYDIDEKHLTQKHQYLEQFANVYKEINMPDWDGQVNVEGWKACYLRTRNGKPEYTKRMTLKTITDRITTCSTIKDHIFAKSFIESCETGVMSLVPPDPDTLIDFFFSEVSCSYALATETARSRTIDREVSGSNIMRISDTIPEFNFKKAHWLGEAKELFKALDIDIDIVSINKSIIKRFDDEFADCDTIINDQNTVVYGNTKRKLKELDSMMLEAIKDGRINMYIGAPGTGKTTAAIGQSSPKCIICSLSNTVAFNGASRARAMGKEAEPYSFSKFLAMFYANKEKLIKDLQGRDILIDEMSQLGISDGCKVLMAALIITKANNTKIILMGDRLQIPSFLSRGSLLESIYLQYPEIVTELTVNRRVDPQSREIVDKLQNFSEDGRADNFNKYDISKSSLYDTLKDFGESTVVIAGSNFQAALINQIVLSYKIDGFKYNLTAPDNWFATFRDYRDEILEHMSHTPIRMRASDTNSITDHTSKDKFKIRRNEEFFCTVYTNTLTDGCYVRIESLLTKETRVIPYSTFVEQFEPAYAITSAKAQGLEWDNVILMYGDLCSADICGKSFKTNYPIRSSFEHFYVGCSRARKSLSIYYGGFKTGRLTPVKKFNMFEVI